MARIFEGQPFGEFSRNEYALRSRVAALLLTDKLAKILDGKNHILDSLRQLVQSNKHKELGGLDDQIALQAKILVGFQASFGVAANRALNRGRLSC